MISIHVRSAGRSQILFSIGMSHWVGRGGHMMGEPLKKKLISIKHHFASLIFRIISPLVGSGPPDKY